MSPPPGYRPYEPQPGSVFITGRGKSGATLMQQMFHQLRMVAATGAPDMEKYHDDDNHDSE